jgi:hypothetical protein
MTNNSKRFWPKNLKAAAISVFGLALGVFAMSDDALAAAKTIRLECKIVSGANMAAPDFASQFCAELSKGLATLPSVKMSNASSASLVSVKLAITAPNAANVHMDYNAGTSGARTDDLKLVVRDANLRPASAQTLLFNLDQLINGP